jgi:hypothetical protein
MRTKPSRSDIARFPVVYRGAESLAAGHLMRRNVLTYPAPPLNEGYDLICLHPDPRATNRAVRVQVKSRMATDSNGCYVNSKQFGSFDYLILVVMNLGYHSRGRLERIADGVRQPDFYVLPMSEVRRRAVAGKREKILLGRDRGWLERYKNDRGIEQIAKDLRVPFPIPPSFGAARVSMQHGKWRVSQPRGSRARD